MCRLLVDQAAADICNTAGTLPLQVSNTSNVWQSHKRASRFNCDQKTLDASKRAPPKMKHRASPTAKRTLSVLFEEMLSRPSTAGCRIEASGSPAAKYPTAVAAWIMTCTGDRQKSKQLYGMHELLFSTSGSRSYGRLYLQEELAGFLLAGLYSRKPWLTWTTGKTSWNILHE